MTPQEWQLSVALRAAELVQVQYRLIVAKKAPGANSWQVYEDEGKQRGPGEPFRELGGLVGSVQTLDQLR